MKQKLKSILLVNDDDSALFLHREIIEEAECCEQIHEAINGRESLKLLTTTCQDDNTQTLIYPQPELVFLDINIPVMNGWEFIQEHSKLVKEQQATVIVAMLTSSSNPNDKSRAEALDGIAGYYQKPLTEEMVFDVIREHFPQYFEESG